MKNIRTMISNRCEKLDAEWQKLSARKQKKWVILFFTGYLFLTAGVVLTVWYDARNNAVKQKPVTGHIQNPVIEQKKYGSEVKDSPLQDSSQALIKNKDHER
ncbi:nitrogen regulatory IIA protein [Chryseobacterium viscerum]|uniref:Nitrogen regulatory IIA protein n=1 Tax=Chryseobacterium viscerum TaxID=1037377 RepID=A0A316WSG8_9FLAO|nr:nitrogen regulatory IIA protein [Chryseobacterium viscerum]PWN64157.1 nitrogen regulatory IIA protein [Chryseobacterium viscerum]